VASLVEARWSRCEAALAGSVITVAASDMDGRFTWGFNAPEAFGKRDIVGLTDDDVFKGSAELLARARAEALRTDESQSVEVRLETPSGFRWLDMAVRPYRIKGELAGTVFSAVDVTDRKVQEEHLRIVLRELAHRSKNLLAVIQGIARQTAESAHTTQEFVSRFNGRIYSLSRAHDVLTDADWRGARIFDLVRSQIALYAEQRLDSVDLLGDNGFLRPNAAQYMGLALHELTTNAIKYGALSVGDGRVLVRFERLHATMHRFTWHEESRVPVKVPRGRSFGLMMLGEVVPLSVNGSADLHFAENGFHYRLDIPDEQLVE
jgi:two-component sensor histidine kinase